MCIIILYNAFIIQYIKVLNSSCSVNIFRIQKKHNYETQSYRLVHRLKTLKISTLQSQYVLSLLLLVVNNKDKYKANSEIHSINTRQNSNLNLSNDLFHIFISPIMRHFQGIHRGTGLESDRKWTSKTMLSE